MLEPADAPGAARAGAAFATRRRDLGISQRELAARKIISAPALIAFEKGRAWPRERTRARLEEVVRWPAGTLAALRMGVEVSTAGLAGPDSNEEGRGSTPLIVGAVEVAMNTVATAIANLPDPGDPHFAAGAGAALADLRQLEIITARAVRTSAAAPAVIRALGAVRRRYDELMTMAAAAPGATLGQRLYVARRQSDLSAAEAAQALNAPPGLVLAVEREEPPPPEYVPRIEALIANLSGE
jgi:transcriptional regulator with XRE-family HTH domain